MLRICNSAESSQGRDYPQLVEFILQARKRMDLRNTGPSPFWVSSLGTSEWLKSIIVGIIPRARREKIKLVGIKLDPRRQTDHSWALEN